MHLNTVLLPIKFYVLIIDNKSQLLFHIFYILAAHYTWHRSVDQNFPEECWIMENLGQCIPLGNVCLNTQWNNINIKIILQL